MSDTSTPEHLQELQQVNEQLLESGVTSIALTGLDWGPINADGTDATATDYETWTTTYDDASTEESRDENDYNLVQQNGTWLISSDTQPTTGSNSPSRLATPAPVPTTTPLAVGGAGTPTAGPTSMSNNWAGYATSSGTYNGVSGTWTIPQFSASNSAGMDATWVGIGGVNSQDLIQAGTQEQASGSGQMMYSAWVETLPQPSQPVKLAVYAGDSITVSLAEQSPNTWQITLADNTTGQSQQVTGQYQSSHSSAEWIEEAPSGQRGLAPLDNFGTVSFSGSTAQSSGQQLNLEQTDASAVELFGANRQPLVTTSAVGSDGASFSVTRTSTPDTQPTGRSTRRPRS